MIKKEQLSHWQGQMAIGLGYGYFCGQAGDNRPHRHLAHQITFPLDPLESMQIIGYEQLYTGRGFFIPANTVHQLQKGKYCSIYLDGNYYLGQVIHQFFTSTSQIQILPTTLLEQLQLYFLHTNNITKAFAQLQCYFDCMVASERAQLMNGYIYQHLLYNYVPSRQELAALHHLSESRLAHWFNSHFGISLRSYRKWLRLIIALKNLHEENNLTAAAYQSGFTDQAHFSRTCMQMFGIQPSAIKNIQNKMILLPES
ncbi:helix-turn-helix domain-containing protein [Acinetobacter pittii]|uniref:helix-turn-helix domain-containing protein n=1 Tax=Acinetobacter pittii TaxID=48296 RepID=UPI002A6AE435|nr:helix-turn-helix domain-containing protein [Acinetobacter pittii]WPP55096.1 helix-turn-helix domain-containing protein [Acinetobacter pittii]